jgi:hypothetical protein
VAEQIGETTLDGKYPVNFAGAEEVVADKGYHSNEVVRDLAELGVRTYIAEPERGARKWDGRRAEPAPVYAHRSRIRERAGSGCRPGAENGWSGISRISSIPEAWTDCTSEVFARRAQENADAGCGV